MTLIENTTAIGAQSYLHWVFLPICWTVSIIHAPDAAGRIAFGSTTRMAEALGFVAKVVGSRWPVMR